MLAETRLIAQAARPIPWTAALQPDNMKRHAEPA